MTDHSDLIAAAMKRHLRISIDQDWEGMKYAILGIDEAAREIEALSSQSLIIENAALSIGASEIAGPVATSLSEARALAEAQQNGNRFALSQWTKCELRLKEAEEGHQRPA